MNVAICDDNIYMASKIEEIVSSCFHEYLLGIFSPYFIRLSDSLFIKSPTFLPKTLDKSSKICGEAD